MNDDLDRCEWVNVSFGTGSPSLSPTKSIESYNSCVILSSLLVKNLNFNSVYTIYLQGAAK